MEVTLHSRFRTRPTSKGLYQGRVGSWVGVKVAPKVAVVGGYYFTQEEDRPDWESWNRGFGGLEHQLGKWKGVWMARHFAEWFDTPPSRENYYRVRHRVGWESRERIAPYANVEYFWDRQGWRSVRYQAGTRFRINPRTVWDFHYFHEPRRQDAGWWPRNMWGTTLEIRLGELPQPSP